MEAIPFNDPKTMSFGFTASRFEEDREVIQTWEAGANELRSHYRTKFPQPLPEGAKVVGGWVEQTLTFSDFYQQRSQESRRIGEYFAQDIKEAAERGRKRKE